MDISFLFGVSRMTVFRTFLIATLLFSSASKAAPIRSAPIIDHNPTVRVRLKTLPQETFEIIGSQIKIGHRSLTKTSFKISFNGGVWSANLGSETYEYVGNSLPLSGQSLYLNKVFLPPSILLVARDKQIEVIASLPLETYLEGVVASEIPKSWPHEAQKAQAIAARTFTLNKIKERAKIHFDVEATILDQVFNYRKYETMTSSQKAVRETRGQFIANSVGIIEPIFYHASCGGATDGADKVFGQPVSKSATGATVKDYCALNTKTSWQVEISKSELMQKLQSSLRLSEGVEILGIEPEQKSIGGRVIKLALNTSQGSKSLTGEMLRSLIGYTRIKSTRFTVAQTGDHYIFSGKGLGHGVGLCQWGARDLALKGKSANQILEYYFPYLKVRTQANQQVAVEAAL